LARDSSLPAYMQKHWLEELSHRQRRLEGKVIGKS